MADSDGEDPRPESLNSSCDLLHNNSLKQGQYNNDNDEEDLAEEVQDFRLLASAISRHPHPAGLISRETYAHDAITAASERATTTTPLLRKSGEKDFEANATQAQARTLQMSRQAMHDALAVERIHSESTWVVGYLIGKGSRNQSGDGQLSNVANSQQNSTRARNAERDRRINRCVVRVDRPRGVVFGTMGVGDERGRVWLLPEEALYLLERGTLDVRWGVPQQSNENETDGNSTTVVAKDDGVSTDDDVGPPAPLSDIPMSLQAAYATFISEDDLTLELYTVYAGLRRSGYTVVRADKIKSPAPRRGGSVTTTVPGPAETIRKNSSPRVQQTNHIGFWAQVRTFCLGLYRFFSQLCILGGRLASRASPLSSSSLFVSSCSPFCPLVAPGIYRSYADIYRALNLIPFHDPLSQPSRTLQSSLPSDSQTTSPSSPLLTHPTDHPNPFQIHYHVYRPSTPFRKTSPPVLPDISLCVVDVRSHPHLPTISELGNLLEEMPAHDPQQSPTTPRNPPNSSKTQNPMQTKTTSSKPSLKSSSLPSPSSSSLSSPNPREQNPPHKPQFKSIESRLKTGTRSVVLALVDGGVVSFLRLAETGSGREKVWKKFESEDDDGRRGGEGGKGGVKVDRGSSNRGGRISARKAGSRGRRQRSCRI